MREVSDFRSSNLELNLNIVAITLMMIGEICFYTIESIQLYSLLVISGIFISFLFGLQHFSLKIRANSFILWVTLVYTLFFIYGYFFNRFGIFPISSLGFRFFENIALYLSISRVLHFSPFKLVNAFIYAGLFSICYLVYKEGASIALGGVRIGDSLSGNVNTVGFCFGLVGLLLIWRFSVFKQKSDLFLFFLFTTSMLLSGSKKTLIILLIDLFIIYFYNKQKTTTWLKLLILVSALLYIILNVPYFYAIIGVRVEQMLETIYTGYETDEYSYSTYMRERMILEAGNLFLQHPILGGGWNYFASQTILGYEYSHSNFMEMLSSFGLVGIIIYYSKHVYNMIISVRLLRLKEIDWIKDYSILSLALLLVILVIDWAAVTFSAQSLWYLPVIISTALVNEMFSLLSLRVKNG